MNRPHINEAGQFQSDKYPTCPPGKVPLSVADTMAQDLLWEYAQRRRSVDAEFSEDLETALKDAGYDPLAATDLTASKNTDAVTVQKDPAPLFTVKASNSEYGERVASALAKMGFAVNMEKVEK